MPRKQKLLAQIKRNSGNVSLHNFEALIKVYGDIEEGGKHPKAVIGSHTLPCKRENPVKSCYVKELLGIIEEAHKANP